LTADRGNTIGTVDKRTAEANLFEFFMTIRPDFAGTAITDWTQPLDDPPDVVCHSASGADIAVELTSWLDERQMARAKQQHRIREDILSAIGEQPLNETQHLQFVFLDVDETASMRGVNSTQFRAELLNLISTTDEQWHNGPYRPSARGITVQDFSAFPTLGKVLHAVQFVPRKSSDERWIPWIDFTSPGVWFSPKIMMSALKQRLIAKRDRYRDHDGLKCFAERILIVHYDQALLYNTPVLTPRFKFADVVTEARYFLAGDAGCFTRMFLLFAFEPDGQVFQLHP
jgi:hypothetical protein